MKSQILNYISHFKELDCDEFYLTKNNANFEKIERDVGVVKPASRILADKAVDLVSLKECILQFDGCKLKETAKNTVISRGNEKAKILLIGEAPGATEDEQGVPFCGQSGKLLDNILLSIGLKSEDVYITNTVFWRPPANRRPTPDEIEICRPFVEKHIALINPALIVMVGSTAVESLFSNTASISSLKSEIHEYQNVYMQKPIQSLIIFHPSYLLRQPYKKKDMWIDMLKIKALLASSKI